MKKEGKRKGVVVGDRQERVRGHNVFFFGSQKKGNQLNVTLSKLEKGKGLTGGGDWRKKEKGRAELVGDEHMFGIEAPNPRVMGGGKKVFQKRRKQNESRKKKTKEGCNEKSDKQWGGSLAHKTCRREGVPKGFYPVGRGGKRELKRSRDKNRDTLRWVEDFWARELGKGVGEKGKERVRGMETKYG